MTFQSSSHIAMMEPAAFYSNPETMETNTYQAENPDDLQHVHLRAVVEFRALRDRLVGAGVMVTTLLGQKESPDDIFCNNWVSTHAGSEMVLYPMLAPNRRIERRPELLEILARRYRTVLDLSGEEQNGRFLESTGSLALDRVNKRAYVARSPRTNDDLARRWADVMGYELVLFDTMNHAGKPVYHSDVMMYIGTSMVGICADCILPQDVERVLGKIRETHDDILLISTEQLRAFCGNALEVRDVTGRRHLAMSGAAHTALRADQKDMISAHFDGGIVSSPIPTIEKYGGGSVRCMLLELH